MNKKSQPKIKVSENGPYLVEGNVTLDKQSISENPEGESCCWHKEGDFDAAPSYALCRCGKSKNKPFCDGSHVGSGFKCSEAPTENEFFKNAERFEGKNLTLFDNYDLCASARFCDRASGIWELIKKDDEVSQKIAREECADCPSGRLVLQDLKSQQIIEPELAASISVTEDPVAGVSGPLWVKGCITIENSRGEKYETRNRVTLCRCGKSKNMPFCDSSHISSKFDDGIGKGQV